MRTELEGIFNDSTLLADLDSALPEGSVRELNPAGRRRIVILVTKRSALPWRFVDESQLRRPGCRNRGSYW